MSKNVKIRINNKEFIMKKAVLVRRSIAAMVLAVVTTVSAGALVHIKNKNDIEEYVSNYCNNVSISEIMEDEISDALADDIETIRDCIYVSESGHELEKEINEVLGAGDYIYDEVNDFTNVKEEYDRTLDKFNYLKSKDSQTGEDLVALAECAVKLNTLSNGANNYLDANLGRVYSFGYKSVKSVISNLTGIDEEFINLGEGKIEGLSGPGRFSLINYNGCLEETVDKANELWEFEPKGGYDKKRNDAINDCIKAAIIITFTSSQEYYNKTEGATPPTANSANPQYYVFIEAPSLKELEEIFAKDRSKNM